MQLTIKNNEIGTFWDVLEKIHVRNMKANRGRAKLLARLREKFSEYQKDREAILNECVERDEDGQFKVEADGNYALNGKMSAQEINELLLELANEPVVIKGGEHSKRYIDFLDYLSEAEGEFTAEEIILIDKLLEQYETSKGEKEHD